MTMLRISGLAVAAAFMCGVTARAVLFASTGDPTFNTTEPQGAYAGSGWQYEGAWNGFLATAIAPQYFVSAAHIGGNVGGAFEYQGKFYLADASYDVAGTDMRVWHVTSPLPTYAPLYRTGDEVGKELVVFGVGSHRGGEVLLAGTLHGWIWGPGPFEKRWGTNVVDAVTDSEGFGDLLAARFDLNVSPTEAHLSAGDSGGGVFIKDSDGIWKLAGVNFSVDGPYYTSPLGGESVNAALFDQTGFYEKTGSIFLPSTGPGSFYASRISTNIQKIDSITGAPEPAAGDLLACALGALGMMRCRARTPI